MLTNEQINELICEEKIIIEKPKAQFKEESQHLRNDFILNSSDGQRKYSVFIRKHKNFIENFSIGLIYHSDEGAINLYRCNGNHGEVIKEKTYSIPHFNYHIHRISAELLENNINKPALIEETQEYASFEQALAYFCRYVNIKDADKYFPLINQLTIFK